MYAIDKDSNICRFLLDGSFDTSLEVKADNLKVFKDILFFSHSSSMQSLSENLFYHTSCIEDFSLEESYFAFIDEDGKVISIDYSTGQVLTRSPHSVGGCIATKDDNIISSSFDCTICIYNISTKMSQSINLKDFEMNNPIPFCLSVNERIYCGLGDGSVLILGDDEIDSLKVHSSSVSQFVDENAVYSCGNDGFVYMIGEEEVVEFVEHDSKINAICIIGQNLFVADSDHDELTKYTL